MSYVEFPWFLFGARFEFDELGRVFGLFTVLVWLCSLLYATSYLSRDRRRARFYAFFMVALVANVGLVFAADAATFYCLFAIMSLSGYGLVVHRGDLAAQRAGRVYIVLTVVGEVLLFSGIFMALSAAGGDPRLANVPSAIGRSEQPVLITALLIGGFGVKAAALPLHVWLPLAHPVAPTPASAALSGAMIKAGLLGYLRFLPGGELELTEWGAWGLIAGTAAAYYGVLVGLLQRDPKTVLAYSSVSQMGLMTTAVGAALYAPERAAAAAAAAAIFALHHGLAKASLFLSVGVLRGGFARRYRAFLLPGVIVPALSLAAFPLTSGAVAKAALGEALYGLPGKLSELLPSLLALSSLGTALLLSRFVWLLVFAAGPNDDQAPRVGVVLSWILSVLLSVVTVWLIPWANAPEAARKSLALDELGPSAWPALLGVALSIGAVLVTRRRRSVAPRIPAGDIVVLLERAGADLSRASNRVFLCTSTWAAALGTVSASSLQRLRLRAHLIALERPLGSFGIGATLFLAGLLLTYVLLRFR